MVYTLFCCSLDTFVSRTNYYSLFLVAVFSVFDKVAKEMYSAVEGQNLMEKKVVGDMEP